MTGRQRSGCFPAEPYPPRRRGHHARLCRRLQSGKSWGFGGKAPEEQPDLPQPGQLAIGLDGELDGFLEVLARLLEGAASHSFGLRVASPPSPTGRRRCDSDCRPSGSVRAMQVPPWPPVGEIRCETGQIPRRQAWLASLVGRRHLRRGGAGAAARRPGEGAAGGPCEAGGRGWGASRVLRLRRRHLRDVHVSSTFAEGGLVLTRRPGGVGWGQAIGGNELDAIPREGNVQGRADVADCRYGGLCRRPLRRGVRGLRQGAERAPGAVGPCECVAKGAAAEGAV